MYQVEITERARDDADSAYTWMVEHISPAFAEAWYEGLFQQIESLRRNPRLCPVAAESSRFAEEVRELIYGKRRQKHKYRILFSVHEDLVTILYVHHSARRELEP